MFVLVINALEINLSLFEFNFRHKKKIKEI